jgi:2',3'-cyclic-nucleotide 2'-phosphodiesterase (5'-nucleotidase family)
LDTGDALVGGGPLGDSTQGEAVVAGMDHMGYDAMALGPKELSLGASVLAQRMAQAEMAILSANVVLTETGELLADPFTVLSFGGYRVGILGLTRQEAGPSPGLAVLDPAVALDRYLPDLLEQAGVVIVLTNISYRPARALLQSLEGVDLLVAALPGQLPDRAVREAATGMLAVVADQPMLRHAGRRVGRLAVVVNGDGSLGEETWASVPMDGSIPDDPMMAYLLGGYAQP